MRVLRVPDWFHRPRAISKTAWSKWLFGTLCCNSDWKYSRRACIIPRSKLIDHLIHSLSICPIDYFSSNRSFHFSKNLKWRIKFFLGLTSSPKRFRVARLLLTSRLTAVRKVLLSTSAYLIDWLSKGSGSLCYPVITRLENWLNCDVRLKLLDVNRINGQVSQCRLI